MTDAPLTRITAEKQKEYLDFPNHCPNCFSPIRKMGRFKRPKRRKVAADGSGFRIRFEMKCPKCKTEFIEYYQLVAIAAKRK